MTIWDDIGDAFSRDGVVTRFTEKIPVVGLATAGVQALAGNGEHAKRALANNFNSVITTAGTVGGFMVGGPVGAVAGGALGSSLGIGAEYAMSTTIDDPNVRGNTGDTSLQRFTTDAFLAGATGMLGGGGGSAVLKQVGSTLGKEVGKSVAKETGASLVRTAVAGTAGQIGQAALDTFGPRSQEQQQGYPRPENPQDEGDDEKDPEQLIRAISPRQAAVGSNYCDLLTAAKTQFAAYGRTTTNQPYTVDMAGQFGQLRNYFVCNVAHAITYDMWQTAKAEIRAKLVTDAYGSHVRQAIQLSGVQGSQAIVQQWNDLLNQLLNTEVVDTALALDEDYRIPRKRLVSPF